MDYNFIGIIERCHTQRRGCGGLITLATIKPEEDKIQSKVRLGEIPTVNFPGRHILMAGQRIGVRCSRADGYWVEHYAILDDHNAVLYSSDVTNSE